LKIGEFKPEYTGKMQFYLAASDETVRLPDENPSSGIIICKEKNRTRVEYTLKSVNVPIGVAMYSFHETLPDLFFVYRCFQYFFQIIIPAVNARSSLIRRLFFSISVLRWQ